MGQDASPRLVTAMRWIRSFADDEGLILWTRPYIAACLDAVDPAWFMTEAATAGLVHPYLGGRPRIRLAYLVGTEVPGGRSQLPPPSIQNGANRVVYHKRDHWVCHLCGAPCVTTWNRRREWPSLDHLKPQFEGGQDYPSNLKTAHVSCNKARRERPVKAFGGSPLTRQAGIGTERWSRP